MIGVPCHQLMCSSCYHSLKRQHVLMLRPFDALLRCVDRDRSISPVA